MTRPVLFLLAACACLAGAAAPPAPLTLVSGGKSSHSICLGRDASPSEQHAARELQQFLQEMSGARLPIVLEADNPKGPLVFVGRSQLLAQRVPGIDLEVLGTDGYVLKTTGRDLVIAGARRRGTLAGVYSLLDRFGCRWFAPGVSRIPKRSNLAVPPLDETHRPPFEYREVFFTEAWDRDWSARNRLNGQSHKLDEAAGGKVQYFPFVHSFYSMIPPDKYFKDHPEYFSLIDGKRRWERGQLCLTNPEVVRLGVEAVRGWIRDHPEATIFSVSQNDWTGWCECDNCRRVEEEEGDVHSGPLLRYVNQVAAEIGKTHPDKLIDTLAYWYTERAPSKTKPAGNVRIRICPIGACEAHPYEQCPYNRLFVNILKDWARVTSNLYVWHYNTNFSHYLIPFPDFDELSAEIDLYRRNGVVGIFLQGAYAPGGGGEMAELRSYVMARLLWDPKTDVESEVNDFLAAYYGPAARPMRAYFDLLHHQVRSAPRGKGHHIWIFQQPRTPYLSREFLDRAAVLFKDAESRATGDDFRRRVRKARLSLDYVELGRARQFTVQGDTYAPPALDALKPRFAAFMEAVRSFGIQQLHEGRPLADDEKAFAERIRPYRVTTLENAATRVRIVPELNARIIEITDKKSGLNLLRVPDAASANYPDLAGAVTQVYTDYHGKEMRVTWDAGNPAGPAALELSGIAGERLQVRKTIQLAPDGEVKVSVAASNPGTDAVPVALLARAEYAPHDDLDGTGLAWRYRPRDGGNPVDGVLFQPGQETTGSSMLTGQARPDGRWTAYHQSKVPALLNLFSPDQAERCAMNWTLRGAPSITLTVWSREAALKPGESLRIDTSYRAE